MPELLLLSGLPASGKSTLAKAWVAEAPELRRRINYDDLRLAMFGLGWKFNRKDEAHMQGHAEAQVSEWLRAGLSVVVDNTNLTARARGRWEGMAKRHGATYVQQDLDTPVEECVKRDRLREGKARVGQAVIDRMALTTGWIDWSDRELYPRDFIVVDMDGTLADCYHRRKWLDIPCPYDRCQNPACPSKNWPMPSNDYKVPAFKVENFKCAACGCRMVWKKKDHVKFYADVIKDPPIMPVVDLVATLEKEYDVLIVSGRPIDKAGIGTEDWLLELDAFPYRHLFMRQTNDYRPDYIIKQEILDLLPKDRIHYCIDDRPSVLRMWQKNGLTTLAVGDLKEF